MKATTSSAEQEMNEKKAWQKPVLEVVGDLRAVIKATNPGKSQLSMDGMGGGGGEEMYMG